MYHSRIAPRPYPWKQAVVIATILTLSIPLLSKAQTCEIYPIALSTQSLSNAVPGTVLSNIYNGTQPGNFGWLSWGGSPSEPTLVNSLTPPGDSSTYVNPDNPGDHRLVLGDWISSKPGVSNSKNVRDALNNLETMDITVPVWSESRGQGANAAYRVSAFAIVRILSYQLPGQNQITAQFVGYADCGLSNQPPVVNAGPDQTITLPASASLNGVITDDGSPTGAQLTASWSEVSGPGTVTFSDPTLTAPLNGTPITNQFPTTVTFPAAGTYVLQLTASDSQFTSSNNVIVTVDRPQTPPIADSQSVTLNENSSTNILLQGSDPDGDPISFIVVTLPNYGTLSGTPPNLTYTPIADFSGQDSFTFETFDGLLYSSNATVSITITPVVVPPVADSESYTNDENTSLPITLSGSDVQGKPLTFQIITGPTNGVLSGTPPNVIYNPASNYFGPDAFTFKDNNGVTDSVPALISITVAPVDEPPLVEAGPDQLIIWPTNTVNLAGSITYWVFPGTVDTVQWSEVSGPGTVSFANPSNEVTTANFSQSGLYVLQLMASDSFLSGTDTLAVTVDLPPTVSAGPDQTNTLPSTITLYGTASDDGLPTNGVLTVMWSFVSGPGTVVFSNPNQTNTTVSFSQSGIYDLRLTANDGVASSSSDVTVLANQAPIVDAGSDQIVTNLQITLNGTVFDDGLPNGTLLVSWTEISGPGVATFANSTNPATAVTFSQPGVYVLQLTANDSLAQSSAEVTITVDGAPVVGVSGNAIITLPATDALTATVTDDTLPAGLTLTYQWTQVSGPGTVTFNAPTALATTASFSTDGVYVIQFAASDSLLTSTTNITVIANQTPVVSAGPAQLITLPQSATLNGTATDDGLPYGTLTTIWTQVSGPGTVTFANPNSSATTASFSTSGIYVLQLTASDGVASNSATVTITANQAPVVYAGPNQIITWPSNQVSLAGSATDDGLPYGTLTTTWALVSGPGTVTFGNPAVTNTTATFSAPGLYVLQLSANDGAAITTAQVTIILNQPPVVNAGPNQTILWPSNQVTLNGVATDDGLPFGTLTVTWSEASGPGTVTFGNPAATNTTVTFSAPGLYVLNLGSSDGSASTSASTTITVDQAPTVTLSNEFITNWPSNQLVLSGTVIDDGLPIGNVLNQVWTPTNGPGTISFAPPVQTNALTGTPITNAISTTATASAPGLYNVQLTVDDGVGTNQAAATVIFNQPPTVSAGAAQIVLFPSGVTLNGVATDDGLPYGTLTTTWSQVSGPGTVTFVAPSATNTTATFSAPGLYVLQLTANDGAASSSATVTITVDQAPTVTLPTQFAINWPSNQLTLNGTVTDDGLPIGAVLNQVWTQISGTGAISFSPAVETNALTGTAITNAVSTTATASAPGLYNIQLTVDDGVGTNQADATLIFNQPPTVNAGSNQVVTFPQPALLNATATDDGLPIGQLTYLWAQVSGPGIATFANPSTNSTSVSFSAPGVYVLQFSANDSMAIGTGQVTILANVAPVAQSQSVAVVEDSSTNIVLQASDTDGDSLSFAIVTPPQNGTLSQISSGQYLYTPAATYFGSDSFTFKANDGYVDSAPATVTLNVLFKNHPPTFTAGPNRTVLENAGSQTIAGWASNISPGPADESYQTVQFLVSSDSPRLFSAGPSIATNGTLTYTPAANTNGVATVTVQAQDNGGTANGGIDTSAPQTFTITIVGPPILAVPGPQTVGNVLPLVFDTNRLISISDAYVGQGTMQLSASVSNGAVTFGSTNGLSFVSGTNGSSSAVVTGTLSNLNASLLNLTYTSIQHFVGTDTLSLVINDLGNNGTGSPLAGSNSVAIFVFRTNLPPVFVSTPVTNADVYPIRGDGFEQAVGPTNIFNLGTWTDVQYGPWTQGPADWILSSNNTVALEASNSDAAILVSDFTTFRQVIQGSFSTSDTDHDFMGFVFGYQNSSNYYVFDWRNTDQPFDNTVMEIGMSVKVVTGNPNLTGGYDLAVTFSTNVNTIHTIYHNSIPYQRSVTYQFTLDYQPGNFIIQINQGSTVLTNFQLFDTTYPSGKFGFYNYSQANVLYSGFDGQQLVADSYVYQAQAIDPDGDPVTYSLVSGPTNMIVNPTNGLVQWYFYTNVVGSFPVTIKASDGQGGTALQTFTINVPPPIINQPPFVSAGPDCAFSDTNTITLNGVVLDDGIPTNTPLQVGWSEVYGPGTVTFGNPNSTTTPATFSTNGIYVLELWATDTLDYSTNFVTVRANEVCTVQPPPGLVAWWPGTLNTKDTVSGVMASATNITFPVGEVGPALSFDGSSSYMDAPAQPTYNVGSNGLSLEFWLKPGNFQLGSVLGWSNGVRVERVTTSYTGDSLRVFLTGTNSGQYITSPGLWISSEWAWTHFAVTYDAPSGIAALYVNGDLSLTNYVGTNLLSTAGDFYLGHVPGSANFFPGMLDEVSIYSQPLNGEEVYDIFAAGSVGKCPDDGDQPPVVYAGPDLFVTGVPGVATLAGQVQVTDNDGQPVNLYPHIQWSQLAGPGKVTFANSNSAATTATFSTNGVYVLQLAADDGESQSSDVVEVRVEALCTVNDPQGLAAWWPANGSDVEALHGYPAIMNGSAGYANGKVGAAFNFDGVDDYIEMPAQTNYNVGSSPAGFSIEWWMNPATEENGGVMGWANGVRFERYSSGSSTGDSLHCYIGGTNSGQFFNAVGVSSAVVSNWNHLVLTYDHVLGAACMYLNGVLYVSNYVGTNVLSTAGDFYMGRVPGSAGLYGGRLDEVSLYARPLNTEEVYSLFISGSTGKCPNNGNTGPVVSAGPDLFVTNVPGTATLNGGATDDGLPPGSTLHFQWSKFAGPGTVAFANSTSAVTTATFSTNGVYVLQLTADDGEMQDSALVEVRVETLCNASDPSGLVAWWPANGDDVEVINGYDDSLLYNGMGYTNGEVAAAFAFNGVNNYVWLPAHTNYNVGTSTNGFTVEFWLSENSFANTGVLGWANGVRAERISGPSGPGTVLRFDVAGTGAGQQVTSQQHWFSSTLFNQWFHIALTYDRTTGEAKIYVNGLFDASANVGTNIMSTASDFYLGQVPGASGVFSGALDEISLYARPLNAQEVFNLFSSGSTGKCPDDGNMPPVVSAGPDLFITGNPGVATLNGTATDDGLPVGSTLQVGWSVASGPGTVTFANSNSPVTTATFSTNGIYVLQLAANDGEYQVTSLVEVRVDTLCVAQDPAGLAAWWPANNSTLDVINGQYALNVANTGYTTGEVAQAFQFNGVNNFIVAPASTNYDIGSSTNGFTIEFWIKTGFAGSGQGFLSWNNSSEGGTNTGVSVQEGGGNANGIVWNIRDTNGGSHLLTLINVFGGNWTHVALTYNRLTGLAEIYTDGVFALAANIGSFQPQTSYDLVFGQVPGAIPLFSPLDEISLYRRPLTPAEILSIYQSGSIGKCPDNGNHPPTVYAGPNLSLASTNVFAQLNGVVYDDGLPLGGVLQSQWTMVDGPGVVIFGNSNSPATTAVFSTNGIYTLQLAANDGEQQSASLAQVRVGTPCGVSGISNLVAWWTGNSNAVDQMSGIPGFLVDGVGYSTGKVASAFQFNNNGYVYIPAQTNYDIGSSTNGFTVEFWINTGFSSSGQGIFSWNNSSESTTASDGVYLWESGAEAQWGIPDTSGTNHTFGVQNVFNVPGWMHIALTYNRSTGVADMYTNGVLLSAPNLGIFQPQTSYDLNLGRTIGVGPLFAGQLDEFSLYNRPLTKAEIQSIVNAGAEGKCVNMPPFVYPGANQTIAFPTNTVTLSGIVEDDGLPSNTLAISWTYVSGDGTVFLSSTNTPVTTVTFTNTGIFTFQLSASDGQYSTNATVTVTVLPDTRPRPVVSITSPTNGSLIPVPVGGVTNLLITATASSADAPITNVEFLLDGAVVGLSTTAPYSLDIPNIAPATYSITAIAMAADGLSTTSTPVTATIFIDQPPEVGIFAPADATIVTAPTNMIGIASSPILQSWQVRYRLAPAAIDNSIPTDSAGWTTLASGSTSVVSNTLAVFDPTMLLNGIYQVQVVATDLEGRIAYSQVTTLMVDRNLKIGNFTISFNDLTVPVAGIPIQIVRTYDSRDHTTNDFGVGWSIDVRNVRLQKNRSIGPSWYEDVDDSGILPSYFIDPVNERDLTVTLANGQEYKFTATFSPSNQIVAIDSGTVIYQPTPDTYATLESVEGDDVTVNIANGIPGVVDLFDDATGDIFNPTLFKLTTEDGVVYIIDETAGLQSMSDRSGNTLLISTNGILWTNTATGTSQAGVTFVRDGLGRISQIIDPSSNVLNYAYGTNGSLAAFTDGASNTTTFAYTNVNFPNYLTGITDPRGQQPIRTIYDDSGRMVQQIDAAGNVVNFNHGFGNNRDMVTDQLGYTTVNYYDNDGNVVVTVDALGNTTTFQYDSLDNLLQKVDALGNTNTYTYDSQGNKLTETDPLGNTIYHTYGPFREETSITTARGYTTTNVYDPNSGMVTQTTDALGNPTSFAYSGGKLNMRMDALGNIRNYSYDTSGHLTLATIVDAQGNILNSRSYTHDANGNELTKSETRTTPEGVQTLVTAYTYDAKNRPIQTIEPDGATNQIVYAVGLNKPAMEIDGLGHRTDFFYDAFGNLTNEVYPDQTQESFGYDADNRKISSTDRAGRTTFYTNDALGRLIATRKPDGSVTQTFYDGIGRKIAMIDELGNSNHINYDPNCGCSGRQTDIIDALGHDTHYSYDADANPITMVDALGRTNTYVYDALNRRTQTIFPDGTQTSVTYDALGRIVSRTDQNTNTTSYGYDGQDRLIFETNSLGKVKSYVYDEVGNPVRQTDADGHTTISEFDAIGRRTKRTLPLGQVETSQYDAAGNLTNHVDFNGHSTYLTYDAANRLQSKLPDAAFGAPPVTLTYTSTGKRASMSDAGATVTYLYNSRDWITNKTVQWNLPGGGQYTASLSYAYDAHGNLTGIQSSDPSGTSVAYQYDALDRLVGVNDTHLGCCTAYGFDPVNNLTNEIYPNGIATVYQYDSLRRLTNLMTLNGQSGLVASYNYTIAAGGQRLTAAENVVATNGVRTVNRLYNYDATYRLTGESLAVTGPISLAGNSSLGYTYDNVGNRLSRVSTLSEVPAASYNYDLNDHLASDTYDNDGNTVSGHVQANQALVNDQYDFEDRLVNRNNGQVTIAYDGDGNRVSKTVGGITTLYLVDDRNPTRYAQVLEEYTAVGSQVPTIDRVYTYGRRLISENQLIGNQWVANFYGYDGHGSVRFLTGASGLLTDTYDYDAFGNLISESSVFQNPTPNSYLFNGEQFDADLGLYYNRARYMNPDSGRFWTRDPLLNKFTKVLELPAFEYVLNDPVNQTDPSGELLDEELLAMTIGAEMDVNMSKRNLNIFIGWARVLEVKTQPAAKMRQVALNAIAAGADEWAYDWEYEADVEFSESLSEFAKIYEDEAWDTLKAGWSTAVDRANAEMDDAFSNLPGPQTQTCSGCGGTYNAPGLPNQDPEIELDYQDTMKELAEFYIKLATVDDDDAIDKFLEPFDKAYDKWQELQEKGGEGEE